MTLKEAIQHCKDVAYGSDGNVCKECRHDHLQLAKWLEELQILRKINKTNIKNITVNSSETEIDS